MTSESHSLPIAADVNLVEALHDETELVKQLQADKDVIRSQERNTAYERDIDVLEELNGKLVEALQQLYNECVDAGFVCAEDYNWPKAMSDARAALAAAEGREGT